MPTECLFRDDAYLKECGATVRRTDRRRGGIVLDRTVFYAAGGGQPGDTGRRSSPRRRRRSRSRTRATPTRKDRDRPRPGTVAAGISLKAGRAGAVAIDWDRAHARMRMHTALHLLSAVLPYPVTGGSVGDAEGRLDFDIPEAGLDKDEITGKLAE